jgi:hypothetical protein
VQAIDGSFGVGTNGSGFTIEWVSGMTIVVEACTNLASASWTALQTCTSLMATSISATLPGAIILAVSTASARSGAWEPGAVAESRLLRHRHVGVHAPFVFKWRKQHFGSTNQAGWT